MTQSVHIPAGLDQPAAILCDHLTRQYGDVVAVSDLDLSVPFGSIFGFLGRNGAGKTTTIRMLAGLTRPTMGRAWIAGIETSVADTSARRMFGYLPQNPAFYSWMSPVEYLTYCARLFDMPNAELKQRLDEMLTLSGLTSAARRRIGGFSGGMLQRLGIAQAMIHNPPVLLLDEPTSSLDPAGRYEVLDLISSLRSRITVFLSSHILADIERVCDTVAIIRSGKLELVAGCEELLQRYVENVVELEVDQNNLPALEAFAHELLAIPWVIELEFHQSILRIKVSDHLLARSLLIPLAAEQKLVLNRLEWVHPTLEEIFLKVSA